MFAIIVYLILGAFALLIIYAYIYYLKLPNIETKKRLMKGHRRAYIRYQKSYKKRQRRDKFNHKKIVDFCIDDFEPIIEVSNKNIKKSNNDNGDMDNKST